VTDEQRIEQYLVRSGLSPQSVEALRPDFPRWIRRLRERGVDQVPSSPLTADGLASNELLLLIKQGSKDRDSNIEHELRNLTRVRRYKL
jgi:hypothetical protein